MDTLKFSIMKDIVMNNRKVWLLYSAGLLLCWVQAIWCCTCQQKTLHEAYCQADFAIVVKISTQTKVRDDNIYLASFKANVRRVFHRPPKNNFITGQEITVKTPSSLSMCRAQVTKNTRYLIGGSIKRNTIYLTSCGLLQPWKYVPKHLRRALRKHSMSCKCSVSGCNSDKCVRFQGAPPQTNNCRNYANFITKCFEQNGICLEKKGVCQWEHNSLDRVQKCIGRAAANPEKMSKSKNALPIEQR